MIAYDWLTELHEFLVVDTETACVDGQYHIIQIAIIPVRDGEVVDDSKGQYATYVNPGVPIDERSQRIHHITDEQVTDAPSFADIVNVLDEWFARENAVFVAHNAGFDLTRLKEEYERIGRPLFDVPLLDTMHLPGALDYPLPEGGRGLTAIAKAFGFTRPDSEAHNAVSDALLTARTLTGLLGYAAATRAIVEWSVLHQRAGGFTTLSVELPTNSGGKKRRHPEVSQAHLATHSALPKRLSTKRANQWVADVMACVELGCSRLRAKCEAAILHAEILYPLLDEKRSEIPDGWKLNTFLPGYLTIAQYAIRMRAVPGWWGKHRYIQSLPVCDRDDPDATVCPDCREGAACPPDVAYQFAAVAAADALGQSIPTPRMTSLVRAVDSNQLVTWINNGMPEIAGYVSYMMVTQCEADGNRTRASQVKSFARTLGLEKVEPQLAMMVALDLYATGKLLDLDFLIADIAARATTDPTYDAIAMWYLGVSNPRPSKPAPTRTEPWSSRPPTRVTTTRFKV